jgi:hypothetical protein
LYTIIIGTKVDTIGATISFLFIIKFTVYLFKYSKLKGNWPVIIDEYGKCKQKMVATTPTLNTTSNNLIDDFSFLMMINLCTSLIVFSSS